MSTEKLPKDKLTLDERSFFDVFVFWMDSRFTTEGTSKMTDNQRNDREFYPKFLQAGLKYKQ